MFGKSSFNLLLLLSMVIAGLFPFHLAATETTVNFTGVD